MKILILLGTGFIALSGALIYAEHKRGEAQAEHAAAAIERVLLAESHSLGNRLDEATLKADRDALNASVRWKKKAKIRSFLSDTSLAEPEAPKWLIVGGRRLRAAGVIDDALLEDALEALVDRGDKFSLYSSKGKYYLFVRGTLIDGQAYAAAYAPEAFFGAFKAGDGLRVWLVGQDGTVLFHPLQRFIGSNVANLRPVAASLQKLAETKGAQFTQRYLGLEGREALGSWTVLPNMGVVVASEWPRDPGAVNRFGALLWLALAAGALGSIAFGFALRPRRGPAPERERVFDVARLDEDALEYLEQAKASAEKAVAFAREQEEAAELARRERSRVMSRTRHLEWKVGILEAFQDRILSQLTGKQVWAELGKLLFESVPGLTVVVYRYAPSTFSLVPETTMDGAALADNALAYLKDSRIFIGNPSYLPTVLQTEAFAKWNRARERHMPLHRTQFRVFPFAGQGGRGAILALYDERINQEGELEEAFLLVEQLVRRTGTFCDSLTPLIQSMYAKGFAGPAVASAPNDAGNRPWPA